MPRSIASVLIGLACLASPVLVRADSMRCGTKLVSDGDTLYEVHGRCGEPAFKVHRVERRTVRRWITTPCAPNATRCGQMIEDTIEIQIDEWTYDFGSTTFVRTVIFEDGRLASVVTGDYGSP